MVFLNNLWEGIGIFRADLQLTPSQNHIDLGPWFGIAGYWKKM